MMIFAEPASLASLVYDPPAPFANRLRLVVTAYLARFRGPSREHTETDLRRALWSGTVLGAQPAV